MNKANSVSREYEFFIVGSCREKFEWYGVISQTIYIHSQIGRKKRAVSEIRASLALTFK